MGRGAQHRGGIGGRTTVHHASDQDLGTSFSWSFCCFFNPAAKVFIFMKENFLVVRELEGVNNEFNGGGG